MKPPVSASQPFGNLDISHMYVHMKEFNILVNFGQAVVLLVVGPILLWLAAVRSSPRSPCRLGLRYQLTVRRSMFLVAWIGLGLGGVHWLQANFATVYAPGYREDQFRRVGVGMTRSQVESIMGPPLRRDSISPGWSPLENWIYSDPPPPGTIGDNYWRRWVMFDSGEGGKVVAIVDDYYED